MTISIIPGNTGEILGLSAIILVVKNETFSVGKISKGRKQKNKEWEDKTWEKYLMFHKLEKITGLEIIIQTLKNGMLSQKSSREIEDSGQDC